MPEALEKAKFEDVDRVIQAVVLKPVGEMMDEIEKDRLENDFLKAYYGVSESGRGGEAAKQWFYDATMLEKIVNKIE